MSIPHRLFASATSLAAALMLLSAPLAQAQGKAKFDDADTNHDGHVTFAEFQAYATERLLAARGPKAQRFKTLTPEERTARLQQRFDRLDHGHKGYLDRGEWGGP